MIDGTVHPAGEQDAGALLREQLARDDAAGEGALPALRHLIAAGDTPAPSDEILARVRGMLADVVESLLVAGGEGGQIDGAEAELLARALTDRMPLLAHLHVVALEWQLTERLEARLGLDPVVSPLLQRLVSAPDPDTRSLAMEYMGAHAHWCHAQRRMKLPLRELPGNLLDEALGALHACGPDADRRVAQAQAALGWPHAEQAGRLDCALRLVQSLDERDTAPLSLMQAGAALFLTALAHRSGQGRDAAVLATHQPLATRLWLALRATGLGPGESEEQLLAVHPDAVVPDVFDSLDAGGAASILSSAPPLGYHGG